MRNQGAKDDMRRWANPIVALLVVATSLVFVGDTRPAAAVPNPLTEQFSTTLVGDVQMTGNAVLTCPSLDAVCNQALIDGSANGKAGDMVYIDVDADATTFNSSSADVTLPPGGTVAWAGLYWAGTTEGAVPPPNVALREQVMLDTPASAGYLAVSGAELGSSTFDDDSYGAFADVTTLVAGGGTGTYTVANVQVTSGAGSTGAWGSWALVVVYEDPAGTRRYVQVNGGYDEAFFETLTFPITGFQSPTTGTVDATVGVYAGDGEPDVGPDSLKLNGTPLQALPLNPATSFLNSTITRFGASITDRNPAPNYSLVSDIDTIAANGVLAPGATATSVSVESQERVWPVVMWVSIEVVQSLNLSKTSSADGGPVYPGDTITYTIDVTNSGGSPIENIDVTDVLPPGVTYLPGTAQMSLPVEATGSFPYDYGGTTFDSPGTTQSYTVTSSDIPAGATLTGYRFAANGSTIDWLSDLGLTATYPGGTAYAFGGASFGGAGSGDFNFALGPAAFGGSALGTYELQWSDWYNGTAGAENTVEAADFTIDYRYFIDSTAAAGDPPSLITAADNVDLAPGARVTITFDAMVDDPLPGPITELTNSSTVSAVGVDPATNITSDTVINPPALSITKSADPDPVLLGETLTYTLDALNQGGEATGVTVTDWLPDNVTFVSANFTSGSGTCSESGGLVTCDLGTMAALDSATIEIEVTVDALAGSQVAPLPATPTQIAADGVTSGPAFRSVGWGGNDSSAGNITVSAAASDFTGSAGFTSTPTGTFGTVDPYVDVFGLGTAAGDTSFEFVFNWDTVPEFGTDSAFPDAGSAILTYQFSEPVTDPVLHIDRLGGFAGPADGSSGTSNSTVLTLLDGVTLTELGGVGHFETTSTSIFRTGGATMSGVINLECVDSSLDGTACGTVQIDGTVSQVRFLMEAAPGSVEGSGGDGIEMIWDLQPVSDLSVVKTASDIIHLGGDLFSYTVTATNNGPNTEFDTAVTESLPTGVNLVSSSPSTGSFDGTTWDIGTLAPGASATLTLNMSVPAGVIEDVFENTVTINGTNTDPTLANNTAVAPVYSCPVGSFPNLAGVGSPTEERVIADNWDQACTEVTASVTVAKVSEGGVDAFSFGGTNLETAVGDLTTVTSGTPIETEKIVVTDLAADVVLTETVPTDWDLVSATCVDANSSITGNSGTLATLDGTAVTVQNADLVPGADIVCTFENKKQAQLTVVKVGVGGGSGFDFTVDDDTTNIATFELNPNPPSNPSDSQTILDAPVDGPLTVTELVPNTPNFVLVNVSCVDDPSAAAGSTFNPDLINDGTTAGTVEVDLVPGADVTCTFTNVRSPEIVLIKNTIGGDDSFDLSLETADDDTSADDPSITLVTAGGTATTQTAINGLKPNGPTDTDLTVTEVDPGPVGFELTDLSCIDLNTSSTIAIGNLPARNVTLGALAAGDAVSCTFVNTKKPTITIEKESIDGTDSFDFSGGTNGLPVSLTLDTSSANPATSTTFQLSNLGQDASITETLSGDWVLTSATCVDSTSATVSTALSGSTLTIPISVLREGRDLTCRFVNATPVVDLAKTPGAITSGSFADGTYAVTYAVTATNTGSVAGAYSFVDTPTPPAGMAVSSVTLSSTDTDVTTSPTNGVASASVSDEPIDAAGTESWVVTVVYTITDAAAVSAGSGSCNEATGIGGFGNSITGDDDTSNNSSCVDVPADPAIDTVKTATAINGDGLATEFDVVGDIISYEIEVTNTGNVPVYSPTVSDPIANAGSIALTSGDDGDGVLEPGETWVYSAEHTVSLADIDLGQVDNTATASGSADTDGDAVGDTPVSADDVETVIGQQDPSLTVLKAAGVVTDTDRDGIVGDVGDQITYTFTVENTGDVTLTNVTVADALVTVAGGPIASLAPGGVDTTTFTAVYTITQADVDAGSVTNTAITTGTDPAGNPITDGSDDPADPTDADPDGDGEPDDPTVVPLTQTPDVSLEKVAGAVTDSNGDGTVGGVGDDITYTFAVENTGNVTLTDVIVTDPLVTVTGGPLASLAPAAVDTTTFTALYSITQADIDAGSVTNTATVTGTDPAGDPVTDDSDDPADLTDVDPDGDGNPDDPTVVPLSQAPDVSLEKVAAALSDSNGDGTVGGVGDDITYSFTVENMGDVTLSDVTVTDPLVTVAGVPIAAMAPGAVDTATFTAVYTITQADVDSGSVTNTATVTGTDPASDPVTDDSDDPAEPTDVDPDGDGEPDDPTVVTLDQTADISLEKTAAALTDSNGDSVVGGVGDEVTYTFTVENMGDVTLSDVTVTDPLVAVAGVPIAAMAPGAVDTATFTAVYTITQADVDSGSVTNTATVTGTDPASDPVTDDSDDPAEPTDVDPDGDGEPDDPTVVTLDQTPSITLAKSAAALADTNGDGTVGGVGDDITYTFTVTNTGDVTLSDVTLTDPLVTVTGGPIATMAPGAVDTATFTAVYLITQADVDAGSVTNTATVAGTDPAGDPVTDDSDDPAEPTDVDPDGDGEPDDPTVVPLAQTADISLEKTAAALTDSNGDGTVGGVGDDITYSFSVTNTGVATLTDVTVTDPLVTVAGGPVAAMAPGAVDTTTFTAIYTITQADVDAGSVTNTATATGTNPASDPVTDDSDDPADPTDVDPDGDGNPDDPTVVPFTPAPDISLEKTAAALTDSNGDGTVGGVGDDITYSFTVENTGNVTLTDVVATDPLVTVAGGPVAAMAPGAVDTTTFTAIYTITQADVDAGSVTNTATATGINPAGDPVTDDSDDPAELAEVDPDGDGDPDDPTVVPLTQASDVSLEKTAAAFTDSNGDGTVGGVGDDITYAFAVTNTGDVTLTDVSVTDPLVTVAGGPIAAMAPGAVDTATFTAVYTITQADIDAGSVTNTATVTGTDPASDPVTDDSDDPADPTDVDPDGDGDPDDPTVVTLTQTPNITLEKVAAALTDSNGDGTVGGVGDDITYAFTVTNTGDVTLTDVTVTDPLVTVSGGPVGAMAPGAVDTTTFAAVYTITQADVDAGSVTNTATVTGTDPASDPVTDDSDDPADPTDVDPDGDGDPDDPTVVTLTQTPNITLKKVAAALTDSNGDGVVGGVGDDITYSFTVENTGIVTLTDVTVTDPLVTVAGGPVGAMAPGAVDTSTFTALYSITQADIDAGSVTNTATAAGIDPASDPVTDDSDDPADPTDVDPDGDGEPDDPTVVPFTQAPDVSLEKTSTALTDSNGDGTVGGVGDEITYTFAVENTGNTTLTNMVVTDPLVTVTGGPIATMAPGDSDTATFTAVYTITQADVDAGSVTNTATVTGSDPGGNPLTDDSDDPADPTDVDPDGDGNPDDPTDVTLAQTSDISLEKVAAALTDSNGDSVVGGLGDDITYTFTVENTGNVTLTDVAVADPLVTVTGGPVATMAPGVVDNSTFTAVYVITQADVDAGTITNTATVTGSDPGGNPVTDDSDDPADPTDVDPDGDGNPDDPTDVTLARTATLSLEKTAAAPTDSNGDGVVGGVGDDITYTFAVENTGIVTLSNVAITDPLVTVSGGPITTMAPAAIDTTTFTAVYTLTQADIDAGAVTNTATATATSPAGDPVTDDSDDPADPTDTDANGDGEPDDPTVVPLTQAPDISLEKTVAALADTNGDGVVGGLGDDVNYTFTVENPGDVTLTDVTITDVLVTVAGGPIAAMAPGDIDSTTFTATYTITQADIDASIISNTATVTGTDPGGDPVTDDSDDPADPADVDPDGDGNPDDPTDVTLSQTPDISLKKEAAAPIDSNGDGVAGGVGDDITYSFTVTNTGDVTLTDISLTDALVTVTGGPVASMAPGDIDAATFTATYTISQADIDAGTIVNTATVTGTDPGGDPVKDDSDDPSDPADVDPDGDGNPDDPTVVTLAQTPALGLSKVGDPQTYAAEGDVITYTYEITNTGNVTLNAPFSVSDNLIAVVDIDCSTAPATLDPGLKFTCMGTYGITAADVVAGAVTNTASAAAVDPGGNPVTSGDVDETVTADFRADLAIVKVVAGGGSIHIPGTSLTYTISVTNNGPSTTNTTTVSDTVPSGTTFVSAIPTAGTCGESGGDITCDLGSMTSSNTATITVVVAIDPASTGLIINTATVDADLPDPNPIDNTSTVTTSPTLRADVAIDKIAPAAYVPGQPITYVLDLSNAGPSTATDVVVTDTLPSGVTFDAANSDLTCAQSAGTVICDPITLAPLGSAQFTITVLTTADMTADLLNTAAAQSPVPDPDTSNNQDSETTVPDPQANLVLEKTGPATPVAAGDQFAYTITVTNDGPSDATTAIVSDPLPAGLSFVSASVSGGSATETCDPTVLCDLGTIASGTTETITVNVQIGPNVTGDVDNTATVTTATGGDDPADNTDNHVVTVVEESDVAIAKIDSVDPVLAGEFLTYTLTVTNAGPSQASAVSISDPLPIGVTFDNAPGCTYDDPSRTVTCDIATLAVGPPTQFDVTVQVDADVTEATVLDNTATVTTPSDSNPANDSDDEQTTVEAEADLVLTKVSSPKPFVPGQEMTYTIGVVNIGPSDAQGVSVTDTLPSGFVATGVQPAADCSVTAGQLDCSFSTLATSESVIITIIGQTDPAATTLTNTATVDADTTDPDPGNNTSTDVNTGDAVADLTVTKTDSVDPVVAGAPLTYTITVTNNGPSDAANVAVADTPPTGFTVDGVDRTECDTSISCLFPVVPAGSSEQIVVNGTVDAALADTGDPAQPELTNTVTVTSETVDGDPDNNEDTETTDVIESADVVLTKIGQGTDITPGQQATFSVEVVNTGPSDADDVTVVDTLPTGLTFVSATGATCNPNAGLTVITCDLGTVPAGALPTVITLIADVAPDVLGGVVNSAEVTSVTPDPAPENNTDDSEDPTNPDADLSIQKIDLADPVLAGTELTYQLTVRNGGASDAVDAVITDTLPAETSFVSATMTLGTGSCIHDGSASAGDVTCDLGTLAAGALATIEIVVEVAASTADGTTMSNSATVTSTTSDPVPADNTDDEDTLVEAVADVGVTKVASADPVTPGESLSYTIRVRNNGPSDALAVSISDTIPAGLSVTSVTGATCAGDPLVCGLGNLTPGQEVEITIDADIDPSEAQSLVNTVVVSTTSNDPNPANDEADTSVPVVPAADLAIDKTGPDTIIAGSRLSYTVLVSNLGPSDAQDVVVSDTLPPGTTLVSATVGVGTGSCVGTTCTFPTVAAGTFASVIIEVDVDPFVDSTLLNSATVAGSTPDPDDTNNDDDHPTTVSQEADLSIVKLVAPDPFVPGRPLSYTIVVTNGGPSAAVGTTVSDPIPAGLIITSATPTVGTCAIGAADTTCDLGDLDDGQQVTIVVNADTDPSIGDTVTNTADVTSNVTDPNPGDESSTVTTEPLPAADLQTVKTASIATATAGETVTYTVELTNLGSSTALDVELTDALPTEVAYLSHLSSSPDATCSYDVASRSVRCTQPAMLPNAAITVDITVRIDSSVADGSAIDNTAGATSSTPDPDTSNNTSTETVDVVAEADLSVVKTLVTDPLVPGATAQYELVVSNAGPSDAQAAQVSDSVPTGLVIDGAIATIGTCNDDGTTLSCDLGTIPAGGSVTVTVDVTVASDLIADVTNTATVTTTTTDPDPTNNTSTTVDTPTPSADLVAFKTTVSAEVVPGETVEYLITIANGGPSDADDVMMKDVLPAGLTALTATPTQGTCAVAQDSVTCSFGLIPAGQSVNVTVVASVASDLLEDLTNTATTGSPTSDPDPSNNEDSTTDPLTPSADLTLVKSVAPDPFVPGRPVIYTIDVANNGPSDATGVSVTDVMPTGVTPTAASTAAGTCTITDSTVSCTIAAIPAGSAVAITIEADTDPSLLDDITNSAATGGETPDPNAEDNTDEATTSPSASADLTIAKAGPAEAVGGDSMTYSIVVTNAGPSTAVETMVSDQLPAGVEFESASVGCAHADGLVTCELGDLAPGSTPVAIDISVTVVDSGAGGTIDNTATITSTTPDPDETNNSSTTSTVITPAPTGMLIGVVWHDTDADGVLDPDEVGIGGVTITITGDPDGEGVLTVVTVTTAVDGTYSAGLPPGEWTVASDPSTYPEGLTPTTPVVDVVTVVAGQTTVVETGLAAGSITGHVWLDIDGDGVVDAGEVDISGVVVEAICGGPDGVIGTADDLRFSDMTESPYLITGVPVGETCQIRVDTSTLPAGVSQTFDPDGTLDHGTVLTVSNAASVSANFGYQTAVAPTVPPIIAFTGASSGLLARIALLLIAAGAALMALASGRRRLQEKTPR